MSTEGARPPAALEPRGDGTAGPVLQSWPAKPASTRTRRTDVRKERGGGGDGAWPAGVAVHGVKQDWAALASFAQPKKGALSLAWAPGVEPPGPIVAEQRYRAGVAIGWPCFLPPYACPGPSAAIAAPE